VILGGLLVAGAAVPDIARGLRFLGRHPRVATAGVALIVVGVVVAIALPPVSEKPLAGPPPCHPAPGPPPERPGGEVRDSKSVHVYVDPASTPHQRALITAAMRRSWAGGDGDLVWDPGSAAFRQDYCQGATVPPASVAALPYFFTFELDVPTDYPALVQEVQGVPGVVAVHRVPEQAG
jgi:hypothetical protein